MDQRVVAYGINNSGQVVGNAITTAVATFTPSARQPTSQSILITDDLGTLGGTRSCAFGINNSGQFVGYSYTSSGTYLAFCTPANRPINPATDEIGTLGGILSQANAINNLGQVVGDSFTSTGYPNAFRTEANQPINPDTDNLTPLDSRESMASAINDSGEVVGTVFMGEKALLSFYIQRQWANAGLEQPNRSRFWMDTDSCNRYQ